MDFKSLAVAVRLPFVMASALPVILAIVWCAAVTRNFHPGYASLCIIGVMLIHIGANTINDYFDWNVSDAVNSNAGPFNGGSRSKIEGKVSRSFFLIIPLVCLVILVGIALVFILRDRFDVLFFSLAGLLLGYIYSSPPFRFHSRGLGEIIIFLTFGPVLCAAACYVMTGVARPEHFFIGIPAGLATTAILWINQFPDHDADNSAGKHNLTVRIGLKASRYIYLFLILSVYLSTAGLIYLRIFPVWSALILLMIPGCTKAVAVLFRNYQIPRELIPAQGFTIQFQMITTLLFIVGLLLEKWIPLQFPFVF